jgi:hypothetical protein
MHPRFLDRHSLELSDQIQVLKALPQGRQTPAYTVYRGLCGPQDRYGRCGNENILDSTGNQSLHRLGPRAGMDAVDTRIFLTLQGISSSLGWAPGPVWTLLIREHS